jgi:formate dehydrogenase maturation protein FdhE
MKLHTVNIIKKNIENQYIETWTFSDDLEGNKQAEELFKSLLKEYESDFTSNDLEYYLYQGYIEIGDFEFFIVHSSNVEEKKYIEKECRGECPKCGSSNINYGASELVDETLIYPSHCNICHTDFSEEYKLEYNLSHT